MARHRMPCHGTMWHQPTSLKEYATSDIAQDAYGKWVGEYLDFADVTGVGHRWTKEAYYNMERTPPPRSS